MKKSENNTPQKGDSIVIYTRVSSDLQVKNWSGMKSQTAVCEEEAKKCGWISNRTFEEWGISWKYDSREELDKMIDYLTKQNKDYLKIAWVVTDDIDRIMRDVVGWHTVKHRIYATGARIHSLKFTVTDDPEWILQQNLIMAMKQYERENNARRVKSRQRGRMLGWYRPTYPPHGYVHVKEEWNGKVLKRSEPDATILADALNKFADGEIPNQTSLKEYLTSAWIKTRKWKKISLQFVKRLLDKMRLLFYSGYINNKKWEITNIKGQHEPLIALTTAHKIIDKLHPKKYYQKHTLTEVDDTMPLRGIVLCPCCNHPMTGSPSAGKSKKVFYYYFCGQKSCENYRKSINVKNLHTKLLEKFDEIAIPKEVVDCLEMVAQDVWSQDNDSIEIQRTKLDTEILSIKKKLRDTEARLLQAEWPAIPVYEKELWRLYNELRDMELRAIGLENAKTEYVDIGKVICEVRTLLEEPRKMREKMDTEIKKVRIGVCIGNLWYDQKKQEIRTPDLPALYVDFPRLESVNVPKLLEKGLEPSSLAAYAPQAYMYTSSITPAQYMDYHKLYTGKYRNFD